MTAANAARPQFGYVPQLVPTDTEGFAATGSWQATMIAAPQVVNPGTREFCRRVRSRTETLLVDPRTASYQFEGYMSMEEARAVPYSPGRGTLGSLWQPRDFASEEARRTLIDAVFALQEEAGAGIPLAPYFAVPRSDHPWLETAALTAREALERADGAAGIVVQVELDGLLADGVEPYLEAYAGLDPALVVVIVTEFDELLATPAETRVALELVRGFAAAGAPVLPAYTGRFGLLAIAAGACGAAGGPLELETFPRRYLREGLVNLRANAHYLPGALVRLPVQEAEALISAEPSIAVDGPQRPTRLVQRRRLAAALEAKRGEAAALSASADPESLLRQWLDEALARCRSGADVLVAQGEPIPEGRFHYLEVLREVAGGPAANLPANAGF